MVTIKVNVIFCKTAIYVLPMSVTMILSYTLSSLYVKHTTRKETK